MALKKIHNLVNICLLVTSLTATVTQAAARYGVSSRASVDAAIPERQPASGGVMNGGPQRYAGPGSPTPDRIDVEALVEGADAADDDEEEEEEESRDNPEDLPGDVEEDAADAEPSLGGAEAQKALRDNHPEEEKEEEEEEEDEDEDEEAYDETENQECPDQQFYSAEDRACRACRTCAGLEVVTEPCGGRRDTQCGPIPMDVFAFLREPVEGGKPSGHEKSHVNHDHDVETAILNEAGNQWRTLSFSLITVLTVICCIVVAVGVYVCVACRRARHQQFFAQPGLLLPVARPREQAEPRYVQTFFTSSRDRVRPARPLPAYQPIYTGSHFLPPLTSALKPDETSPASAFKSSASDHEYIYINCPEDLDEEVDEVVRNSS